MNILLEAYIDKNLGDDLMLQILVDRYPDAKFFCNGLTSLNEELPYKNWDNFFIVNYNFVGAFMDKFDMFVNIGGSVWQDYGNEVDNQKWYGLRLKAVETLSSKKKPCLMIGNNIGPITTQEGELFFVKLMNNLDDITLRDSFSYNWAKSRLKAGISRQTSDVVLSKKFSKRITDPYLIGITIHRDITDNKKNQLYVEQIRELVRKLLIKDSNIHICLYGLCTGVVQNDPASITEILASLDVSLRDRVSVINYEGNIEEFLDSFGRCRYIVASHFHASILAILMQIPFLPFAYQCKTVNFLRDISYKGKILNYENFPDSINEIAETILENKCDYNQSLVEKMVAESEKNFTVLDKFIHGCTQSNKNDSLSLINVSSDLNSKLGESFQEIQRLQLEKDKLQQKIQELRQENAQQKLQNKHTIKHLDQLLDEIYYSRARKVTQILSNIRKILLSMKNFLSNSLKKFKNRLYKKTKQFILKTTLGEKYKRVIQNYKSSYHYIDRSNVYIFGDDSYAPNYTQRILKPQVKTTNKCKVSLITTVLNEEKNIGSWFESLLIQTRLPDELVIVDGGSKDNTINLINKFIVEAPFPVNLICRDGANIAQGRNIAIMNASYDYIAVTDCGCILDNNWLFELIMPFEIDEEVEVCAGNYKTANDQSVYVKFFIPDGFWDPQTFLPSSRSIAFRKNLWIKVNGYPEWLTDAGEDTLFDIHLKGIPAKWAFVPNAFVLWEGPKSYRKLVKLIIRYSNGDGESGVFADQYYNAHVVVRDTILKFLLLVIVGIFVLFLHNIWITLVYIIIGCLFIYRWLIKDLPLNSLKLNFLGRIKDGFILKSIIFSRDYGFRKGIKNRSAVENKKLAIYASELTNVSVSNSRGLG